MIGRSSIHLMISLQFYIIPIMGKLWAESKMRWELLDFSRIIMVNVYYV